MASIDMLQIRGIRSFSPGRDEVIKFYSPLTMIVGANGCGKTTIIEALKFACTGQLPPNSRSGQSFINDPSMTDCAEVKAQIKLKFHSQRGLVNLAIRSLQLTRKRTKLEYKALDAVLETKDVETNERSSLSMKCSELDKQVPLLMGVTSAVLESVIFCHQEESDWPMLEGKVVKDKFDDIFDSTRYSKALDAIMKTRKEKASTAKDLKGELMELEAFLTNAKQIRKDLHNCNDNLNNSESELQEIEEKLERNNERIERTNESISKYSKLLEDINIKEVQLNEKENSLNKQKESLIEVYDHLSDQELQSMISNFDSQMDIKSNELRSLQTQIDRTYEEMKQIRDSIEILSKQEGEGTALSNNLTQLKQKGSNELSALSLKYSVPITSITWSDSNNNEFIQLLQNSIKNEQTTINTNLQSKQNEFNTLENSINEIKNNVYILSNERSNLQIEKDNLLKDIENKRRDSVVYESLKRDINHAKDDYNNVKSKLDDFQPLYINKSNETKKQIKECEDRIQELEKEIRNDDELYETLNLNRTENAAITAEERRLSEDLSQLNNTIDVIINSNPTAFSSQNITTPVNIDQLEVIKSNIEKEYQNYDIEYNELIMKTNDNKIELSKLSGILIEKQKLLQSYELRNEKFQLQIEKFKSSILKIRELIKSGYVMLSSDLTNDPKIEEAIELIYEMIVDMQQLEVVLKVSYKMKKKYLDKRKVLGNNVCPCCQQNIPLNAIDQINQLIETNMNELFKLSAINQWNNDCQEFLNQCQINYQILLDIKPDIQNQYINDENIRNIKIEITNLQNQLNQLNNNKNNEIIVNNLKNKTNLYNKLNNEIIDVHNKYVLYNRRLNDLNNKKRRLVDNSYSSSYLYSSSSSNSNSSTSVSIDILESNLKSKRDELSNNFKLKEKLYNDDKLLSNKFMTLTQNANHHNEILHDLMSQLNKYTDIDVVIKTNQQKIISIDSNLSNIDNKLINSNQLLSNQMSVYNQQKNELNQFIDKKNKFIQSSNYDLMHYNQLIDDINELNNQVNSINLTSILSKKNTLTLKINQLNDVITTINPQINTLTNELNSKSRYKHNVEENMKYRQSVLEFDQLRHQILTSKQSININTNEFTNIQRENSKLNHEKMKLLNDKEKLNGKIVVYKENQSAHERQLNNPPLKNIDNSHRKKFIEYETTELAVKDLDSYYMALDAALQNFHIQKIKEINKIIRELWQLIYKGEDIDNIEVESGQESATGLITTKSGSRSYNYRVVMRKGDVPLDMRGRCSAGQRILASIVIRLALAETFCLNCGILTLDEPTTNLDEPNKAGLAQALSRIIHSRSKQQNFQLICITHDEDFVRMMNIELSANLDFRKPEFYYRVSRAEEENTGKFFSQIERISWEDM